MIDYKKMYMILCGAASDSLDILSHGYDEQSVRSAELLLQQTLMRAEDVYIHTASRDLRADE